jgi:hypothetical protein
VSDRAGRRKRCGTHQNQGRTGPLFQRCLGIEVVSKDWTNHKHHPARNQNVPFQRQISYLLTPNCCIIQSIPNQINKATRLPVSPTSQGGGRNMAELLKPRFSAKRWGFLLVLFLMTIIGIPRSIGAKNLYLPLILQPQICDPAFTQTGTTGDDTQTLLATAGIDDICQYGLGGNDSQYATGASRAREGSS